MQAISANFGYPNSYQVIANPTGAALSSLNSAYARDFGLGVGNVYNLPIDVNMGFNSMGGGLNINAAMMNPYLLMNPHVMQSMLMSPAYKDYLNLGIKDRLEYDADLRSTSREIDYNERKDAMRYSAAADGLTAAINEACVSLQTVIAEGESDQVVMQFEGLVDMIRNSSIYTRMKEEYQDDEVGLEKALRNFARYQFQAATGQDMKAMIQQCCDGALANSFFDALSFGNAQNNSAEDVIAKLEGTQTPKDVKLKKIFGKVGATTSYTAAGLAAGFCIGGPVGALVGGAIGLVGGLVGSVIS